MSGRLFVGRNCPHFAVCIRRHDGHTRVVGLVPEEIPTGGAVQAIFPVAQRLADVVQVTVVRVRQPNLSLRVVVARAVREPCQTLSDTNILHYSSFVVNFILWSICLNSLVP